MGRAPLTVLYDAIYRQLVHRQRTVQLAQQRPVERQQRRGDRRLAQRSGRAGVCGEACLALVTLTAVPVESWAAGVTEVQPQMMASRGVCTSSWASTARTVAKFP
jgi:hypothetical protein